MQALVDIQRWLYRGIGEGLNQVAGGDASIVWIAMATALLFGAAHALMPGHGKIVLVTYHLGKPSKGIAAFTNGAILVDACRLSRRSRARWIRRYQPCICPWWQNPSIRGCKWSAHHHHRSLSALGGFHASP